MELEVGEIGVPKISIIVVNIDDDIVTGVAGHLEDMGWERWLEVGRVCSVLELSSVRAEDDELDS